MESILESKRPSSEEALRESEERFRALFESSPDALMTISPPSWRFTDCNPATLKMFRVDSEVEFCLLSPGELSPEHQPDGRASAEKAREVIETAMREGSHSFEWTHKRSDGEEFSATVRLTRIKVNKRTFIQGWVRDITEQKQAEAMRQENLQRLRLAIDTANIGLWDWNLRTNKAYYSPEWKHQIGIEDQEISDDIGEWRNRIHPDDLDKTLSYLQTFLSSRYPNLTQEFRFRHNDGSYREILSEGKVVFSETGEPIRVFISHRDITESRKAERAMQNREVTLRAITDSTQDAILMMDPKGCISFWNPAAERLLGYSAQEALGCNLHELIGPERYLAASRQAFPEFSYSGRGRMVGKTLELSARHKDGREIAVALSLSAVQISGGWYAVGTLRDETHRKEADARRVRLTTAVEQAAEAIVVTAPDGVIEYVNPAFATITGYTITETLGMTPRILKSDKHSQKFYVDLWSTLLRGEVWRGRIINRRKDGQLFEQESTISPVRDAGGTIVNFVSVSRDVTRMVLLETQLLQAQKLEAVGSLAAGIAHEINTPIQFIGDNIHFFSEAFQNMLILLKKGIDLGQGDMPTADLPPHYDEFLQAAKAADIEYLGKEIPQAIEQTLQGIDRVATIVRAMKDFSHPDKGEKSLIDINKALQTTLIVARNEIKYVADVVTEFAENLPLFPCYPGALNQVFLNILVNAAHAIAAVVGEGSAAKGQITVRTSQEGDSVVVEISDTGTGIPPEIRARIYDPFFTTKEIGKGTGQGLAIVRSVVVDQHGGSISLATQMGGGTTFYVRLPLIAQAGKTAS